MKNKLLAVGLLPVCLVVGLGAGFRPERKVWDYHIEFALTPERANKLGAEGWELATTAREGNDSNPVQYIFKRARQ